MAKNLNLAEIARLLLTKEYKTYLGTAEGPDTTISRSSANRAGSIITGEDEENKKQASGKDIADKMDFDTEKPRGVRDSHPLNFMDIVMASWGIEDVGFDDDDDGEEE